MIMIIPSQPRRRRADSFSTNACMWSLCSTSTKVQGQGACSLSERVQTRLCGDADRSKQLLDLDLVVIWEWRSQGGGCCQGQGEGSDSFRIWIWRRTHRHEWDWDDINHHCIIIWKSMRMMIMIMMAPHQKEISSSDSFSYAFFEVGSFREERKQILELPGSSRTRHACTV